MTCIWEKTLINNIDEPLIVTLSPRILSDSHLFTCMLQPKSQCQMNVIPPYGRPALIPLVTSMDDSEKEFTSTPSVDGIAKSQGKSYVSCKASKSYCFTNCATYSLHHPSPYQLNDAILLDILITKCWLHRALLSHAHLHSCFVIGAIVRRQQEVIGVHRYPALLLPVTWVRECLDNLL